jgi:hypothetical protein
MTSFLAMALVVFLRAVAGGWSALFGVRQLPDNALGEYLVYF